MPQKQLPLEPGHTYHIWTHANGSDNLFRSEENYHYFLKKYQYYIHPVAETFAYCLMPNHLHLMVRVRSEDEILEFLREKKGKKELTLQGFQTLGGLPKTFAIDKKKANESDLSGLKNLTGLVSQQFSNLFNAYTKAFNKKYDRKGSLFNRPFQRKKINSDEYFVRLIAYIHNNPIHHGFTKNLNDWPFSSWGAYVMDKITKISKGETMQWFGSMENFKTVHQQLNFEKCISLFEN